jgi:probable phosphoglycerate mutase
MRREPDVTRLYLIRHGQAVCNVPPFGTVAGPAGDEGLTALGREQAARLRDRLAATGEIEADVLIASTLPRAMQTAEIIQPALGLPIVADDAVQEISVGDLDGRAWSEVKDSWPDHRVNPFQRIGATGENWGEFVLRVGTALNRIVTEHDGKNIVVVCHGGVVDASLAVFFGMNTLTPGRTGLLTHNTSITLWMQEPVDYEVSGSSRRWRLAKYNDDTHIRDIGAAERLRWVRFVHGPSASEEVTAVPLPTEEDGAGGD